MEDIRHFFNVLLYPFFGLGFIMFFLRLIIPDIVSFLNSAGSLLVKHTKLASIIFILWII